MNGEIQKSAKVQGNEVSEKDLELINQHTMRELKAEEVFTFKLAMCDNQIDRTFEQFTDEALKGLAELFKGKTVISDHTHKTDNQCARIYNTEVEKDGSVQRLVAYCYTLRSDKNKDFIADVEAGIKKEVSVGCAVEHVYCSICGTDNRKAYCPHYPGKEYDTKLAKEKCIFKLDGAVDAYEVSFVAVPAQKEAGVTKSYGDKEYSLKDEAPKEENMVEKSDIVLELELMDAFIFTQQRK